MVKDILQEFFGVTESDSEKVINSASELIEEVVNEMMNDDEVNDYFSTKRFKYNNGKLTESHEKEYVNGKCTKDKHYSSPDAKNVSDGTTNKDKCLCGSDNSNRCQKKDKEIKALRSENDNLRSQINEMTTYIDGINDKIKKLEFENDELRSVVDKIKKCL